MIMMVSDIRGLSFPNICLTVEEKPQKKPQPGKLTELGIEPGPARSEATVLPLDHSDGLKILSFSPFPSIIFLNPKGLIHSA